MTRRMSDKGRGRSYRVLSMIPNLGKPADVSRLAHRRRDPGLNDGLGLVGGDERGAERKDVGAVVLARIPGQRAIRAHRRADTVNLVGRDGRAQPGAVDDNPGIDLAACDQPRDVRRDVGIVHGIRALGADVLHGQPAAPQQIPKRRLQRNPRVIATDREPLDLRPWRKRRQIRVDDITDDRNPPRPQRIERQRRNVPTRRQLHRRADLHHTCVGFSNDVELLQRRLSAFGSQLSALRTLALAPGTELNTRHAARRTARGIRNRARGTRVRYATLHACRPRPSPRSFQPTR